MLHDCLGSKRSAVYTSVSFIHLALEHQKLGMQAKQAIKLESNKFCVASGFGFEFLELFSYAF